MAIETNGVIITGDVNDINENNVVTFQALEKEIKKLKSEINEIKNNKIPIPIPKPVVKPKVVYKNECNDNYEKDYVFNRFKKISKKEKDSAFMRFHYGNQISGGIK